MSDKRMDLLAQIAVWYYEDEKSQDEIGELIGKSRSTISRMLNECKELGLIEVKVKYPPKRNYDLEQELNRCFGLKDSWIANSRNMLTNDMKLKMVSQLSAKCLISYLFPGVKVGIGWSRTLFRTFKAMPEHTVKNSMVVQMSGSAYINEPNMDGADLTRTLSMKLGAQHYYFPAPLVVSDPDMKNRLMEERSIKEAMEKANDVDIAIVGIGNINTSRSSLINGEAIDELTLKEVRKHKPAGDILACQIGNNGEILEVSLNERIIGVHINTLKDIPTVIAVSSGSEKVEAVHAAIKGGWVNVLVSDDETIEAVLDIERKNKQGY